MAATETPATTVRTEDGERADLVRVLRNQVRSGRYYTEPEALAEQLMAWFAGVSD